ncbi:MAG: hypothetical protein ACRDSN_07630, partial [Pseudonocardiaceae bacterium]
FSHLIEPIVQGMEQLAQKMQEFWDRVNQLREQPGNSDRLRDVGAQWAEGIGNVLGDIAGTISLDRLRTNIEWTGSAAEAYRATVPAQGEALNGLKDLAIEMRTSLAAVGAILTAVAACVGLITMTISALDSHLDTIQNQQTTIQQGVRDVGGEWSRSNVGAMSDASVTDGDGSDWRPQQ